MRNNSHPRKTWTHAPREPPPTFTRAQTHTHTQNIRFGLCKEIIGNFVVNKSNSYIWFIYSIYLTCNVMRTQSVKDHTLFRHWGSVGRFPVVKTTSSHKAILFIFIGRMLFLALNFDNADPLFALVITSGFDLHHIEVAEQHSASGRLYVDYSLLNQLKKL